jgi:hypothetical protein
MTAARPIRPATAVPATTTLPGALREALVTTLAATATLCCALTIAQGPGAAVLAVVLCVSLSRSQLDRDWRHRIEAAIALPVVGLAAIGVGLLLRHAPWLGAGVFSAGLFLSIWLRRFGPDARRAGSLIALPFVALLVTPHVAAAPAGRIPPLLVPVIVALLALVWVGVLHALARWTGFLPPPPAPHSVRAPSRAAAAPDKTQRLAASTRMAVQMAAALALAFIVGYVFFRQRWAWIVLTAFIVNGGNRGRLDVAYKSVLRVAGAAAGTILALVLGGQVPAHDAGTGVLILAAVFFGVWLRPFGYAWWALFVTIALALLQGFADIPASQVLWMRLEEIVIGAAIGVTCAWWILPVRSTGVLRRRIGVALAALGSALDPATNLRTPAAFAAAVADVEQLMPAFRAWRLVTRRFRAVQPACWIDALVACRDLAARLIEDGETPAHVRCATGAARKALLEPVTLLPALLELQRALASHQTDEKNRGRSVGQSALSQNRGQRARSNARPEVREKNERAF